MPVACRIARRQREVAGVLGDLGLPGLALLLEGLQPRDHHDQQLQDDARGDVGHDPQREDRQLEQRAAGEQVDQAVDAVVLDRARRTRWTLATLTPGAGSCEPSRKTTMIPRTKSSLRRRSGVRNALTNAPSTRSSFQSSLSVRARRSRAPGSLTGARRARPTRRRGARATGPLPRRVRSRWSDPPAAAIFSLAEAENACALTCTAEVISPLPRTFTGWPGADRALGGQVLDADRATVGEQLADAGRG